MLPNCLSSATPAGTPGAGSNYSQPGFNMKYQVHGYLLTALKNLWELLASPVLHSRQWSLLCSLQHEASDGHVQRGAGRMQCCQKKPFVSHTKSVTVVCLWKRTVDVCGEFVLELQGCQSHLFGSLYCLLSGYLRGERVKAAPVPPVWIWDSVLGCERRY